MIDEDRSTDGKLFISTDNAFHSTVQGTLHTDQYNTTFFVRKNQMSSEFMGKIYAASGRLLLIAEADRVLCHLMMFKNF